MPRKKDIMPPTAKRTEGAIYNFEMRDAHNAAIALVEKCKKQSKRILYLVKDWHTFEEKRVYRTVSK